MARPKILAKENGKRLITPMFFVILTLGTTDLLFALDSIPAIYGLTQDPYLVFTANVFALMGLRQLYFLIGGLLQRLVYLSYGLAFLLGVHRRQAGAARHARERAAVHQRRRARRVGARDPDLALAGRDRGHPRRHGGGQPRQGPGRRAQGRRRPVRARNSTRREGRSSAGDARRPSLSVLDLVPVRSDQTTGDALAATVALARVADELGYRRYWLAEHHNMPAVAATNPPVLIAMVAAATERIRVGSGGVMLPNHAPLVVAEQFALLEAAHPGRIDLGIGRAPGTDPVTSWALRHGAGGVTDEAVNRFPEYVDNVLAMMDAGGVGLQRPGARCTSCGPRRTPPGYRRSGCSGSSDYSARLAAEKGMPYVFAHHFSGSGTAEALELYRSRLPALARARRAADLPDRQRRRGGDPGGGGAAGAAAAARDGGAAHRGAAHAAAAGRGGGEGRRSPTRTATWCPPCARAG